LLAILGLLAVGSIVVSRVVALQAEAPTEDGDLITPMLGTFLGIVVVGLLVGRLVTLPTLLRQDALRRSGGITFDVDRSAALTEAVRRSSSFPVSALPWMVSITVDEDGLGVWGGGGEPRRLGAIPWSAVRGARAAGSARVTVALDSGTLTWFLRVPGVLSVLPAKDSQTAQAVEQINEHSQSAT
jgi:hypothetical protein